MWNGISNRAREVFRWLKEAEPAVLVSTLLIITTTWAFIEIADEVVEGDTQALDKWVVLALREAEDPAVPIGPPWLHEMGRDATAFGGIAALALFTAIAAGYLWLDRRHLMARFLIAATLSGLLVSLALKQGFGRPRPDIVPHLSHVATSSFPSGHSMLAAVVYLTLGSLLATTVQRRRLKLYVLSVALVLAAIVGLSRIYMGVHYPTDVLAGWMAGLAWATICWLLARYLQRRTRLKVEGSED